MANILHRKIIIYNNLQQWKYFTHVIKGNTSYLYPCYGNRLNIAIHLFWISELDKKE